jgi:hypothetical protein
MTTLYEAAIAAKTKPVTERIKTFEDACRPLVPRLRWLVYAYGCRPPPLLRKQRSCKALF